MTYSNDPQINPYAELPSFLPNIEFPKPYWIDKLVQFAIIGCTNPDLAYAELAVAAGANMFWTLLTPSTKQLIHEFTGESWICGARRVYSNASPGSPIANSDGGKFLYGVLAGFDTAAYFAFLVSTGAKGVIDFGSYAAKFQRKCNGGQSDWRGNDPVGGWPAPSGDIWQEGPSYRTGSKLIGPFLTIRRGEIGAWIAWCSFTGLYETGGVIAEMRIHDIDTGEVLDSSTVDNTFDVHRYAMCAYFTSEGRSDRDRTLELQIRTPHSVDNRVVTAFGGCYKRAWLPGTSDAPPFFNMKTMLNPK